MAFGTVFGTLYASPSWPEPSAASKTRVRRKPVPREAIVPTTITPVERSTLGADESGGEALAACLVTTPSRRPQLLASAGLPCGESVESSGSLTAETAGRRLHRRWRLLRCHTPWS